MLHHACCNYKVAAGAECGKLRKKILNAQKKVVAYAFSQGKFVLVCPPAEKIIVAQRSVQHFCVALAELR
jgi:hypothetical protein